ncbi:MAG: T9SS type A sorting domain-containing protein [Bacteroidota bacterium]
MKLKIIIGFICLNSFLLLGQVPNEIQRYRADEKGDISNRKKSIFDGNLVRTIFFNDGEVSDWFSGAVSGPHFEWPKGSGHRHLDGLTFMVGAKIQIKNMLGQNVTISSIETNYREEMDYDPVTRTIWGMEPIPGYFNSNQTSIAKSNDPNSWPASWPAALGLSSDWNGKWYGYFGQSVSEKIYETFYVMDDSKDKEYTNPPWGFYPIPSDSIRGGLGLRIEVRGFQFTHKALEDVVLWMYDVINISDQTYDSAAFGVFTDPGIGSVNNSARFDRSLDLTYAWAPSGKGWDGTYKTGYYGHALLETPGNSTNGIDDDGDGIVDERQDDGIDNDHDWSAATDDVGADGIPGTSDLGEGDGLPTAGEPDFDRTDNDEKDQIGLQSAYINMLGDKGPTSVWPKNDSVMWSVMTRGFKDTSIVNSNISIVSGSGPFPLKKYGREKFIIAMMCGEDLNDLILNKNNTKLVYDNNFNLEILISSPAGEWNFLSDSKRWNLANNLKDTMQNGIYTLMIKGIDPYLISPDSLSLNAGVFKHVSVTMKNNTSDNLAGFFWTTNVNTEFTQNMSLPGIPIKANDTGFTTYVVDLSKNSQWIGTIKQIRLDPVQIVSSGTVDLKQIKLLTDVTSIENVTSVFPLEFSLSQNYPNPFNPHTIIRYYLPKESHVNIALYDMLGRQVKTLVHDLKSSGEHKIDVYASGLSSGIYYYTLTTKEFTQTKKLILLR